jgi:hypothetical protein
VHWRRDCLCGELSVGEFEEGISAAIEAIVERVSEGAEGVENRGIHSARHCALQSSQRQLQESPCLQRKLRRE